MGGSKETRFRNEARLAHFRNLVKVRRVMYLTLHETLLAYMYMASLAEFPPEFLNTTVDMVQKGLVQANLSASHLELRTGDLLRLINQVIDSGVNREDTSKGAKINTVDHTETVFVLTGRILRFQVAWCSFKSLRIFSMTTKCTIAYESNPCKLTNTSRTPLEENRVAQYCGY
ncbi:hypothetical protein BCR34DRAFT_300687 [Clohesyomyces aquaticus]|uniref:Uncharacterized protein n=1 Tax=Clohesyomyces aquaticus TaxID=1231657 RepID=A0A1Y1ZRL2_9PLEO|nr:hypothetical protein BCR34DRAFT_300687 [Clohesyomyces aquaticus]